MNAKEYQADQAAVARFLQINEVMPGCHGPKYSEEREGEPFEPFFSWQPCECCVSSLGGNRETYLFAQRLGQIIEADICTDCVYFLAYGRLDDQTMMEIESSPA